MSNYPFSFDNNITIPGVSGSTPEDIAITALRSAVFAIEFELGITPSGIYPDVRTRLDILESRINFSVPPGFVNQGYIVSPLILLNTVTGPALTISDGYGVPTENRLNGSLFMRGDGYANNDLYIRRGGVWVPIQTDPFQANCDLSGTYLCQQVVGLRTKPLNTSLSTLGIIQDGYHLTWNFFGGGFWEAQTGFIPGRDLAAFSGPYGRTAQTVIGIQGTPLSTAVGAPADGSALIYELADGHWDTQQLAVVWSGFASAGDGYVARTNIRSNKLQQSPSTVGSLFGMVNFGSSTNGTGGTQTNYAAILGGDRNAASGVVGFPLIVNGYTNSATDGYTTVLNGNNSLASAEWATVINGNANTASGVQAIVLDGASNVASGQNAFVVNGTSNIAAANFSGVLNGTSNTITANSTHAFIGFGTSNQITGGASSTFSVILGGSSNQTNASNVFIGPSVGSNVQSNDASVVNGTSNTIGLTSAYATILSGQNNAVSGTSGWGLIGNGNNLSVTGLYSTILNSTGGTANGVHSLILNGNTNSVTGPFSTVVNGRVNTISLSIPSDGYATILDGYLNTISGGGSLIGDGYNNLITGQFNTILNGNTNTINGFASTILNGSANTIDVNSSFVTLQAGTGNSITNSSRLSVVGNANTITNVANGLILGQFNSVQSNNVKVTGDFNTVGPGTNYIRIYGTGNNVTANVTQSTIFGNNNVLLNSTHDDTVFGSLHTVDGGGSLFGNNTIMGGNNQAVTNFSTVEGQFGKSRIYGQHVHSVNTGFGTGRTGEAQFSRVILDGYGNGGSQFFLQTHDSTTSPANLTFVDGYSYEMQIRVLIVNNQTSPPGFPTVPVRFVFDVLAHQEGGNLVLDDVNRTLQTQNVTSWTVTLAASTNQLTISVDTELAPFINGTGDNRRAIATVEWREISRIT